MIILGHFKILRKNLKNQHESIKSNTTAFKNLTKEVKTLTTLVTDMNSNLEKIAFKLTMDSVDISGDRYSRHIYSYTFLTHIIFFIVTFPVTSSQNLLDFMSTADGKFDDRRLALEKLLLTCLLYTSPSPRD